MKHLQKSLVTAMLLLATTTVYAQKNVEKAFEDFRAAYQNNKNVACSIDEEKDPVSGKLLSRGNTCRFTLTKQDKKWLNTLLSAFQADVPAAYYYVNRDADHDTTGLYSIAYGNARYFTLGKDKSNRLVLISIADPADSLRRYVYAIEWNDTRQADVITGQLYSVYGKRPSKQWFSGRISIDGMNIDEWMKSSRELAALKNMNLDSLMTLSAKHRISGKELRNMLGAYDNVITRYRSEPKDDVDFLERFGAMKSSFMYSLDKRKTADWTQVVAGKLVKLCKNHGKLLKADEKTLCIQSLKEMKKAIDDKFIIGLLTEAIKYLE